jgi:hypothetical protein
MLESETKLVKGSFSSVMDYLVYPQDLRELTERVLGDSQNIEVFLEKIKQAISSGMDSTHKTDGQIFLNELQRNLTG